MKFNFKKIATVLGSALMVGSTMGLAAAANYPTPFVQSGAGDVALVIGANSMDMAYATSIASDLSSKITVSASATTVTGGDSKELNKDNVKMNLNDSLSSVYSTLDQDELSTILADGVYEDEAGTEYDYEQTITLGGTLLTHFANDDVDADEKPVVGFSVADSTNILNYTLDFTDRPKNDSATMETTFLEMMGVNYYISDVTSSGANLELTLLDSANTVTVDSSGAKTITVNGQTYTVEIVSVSESTTPTSSKTTLKVNGEQIASTNQGSSRKIADDTYLSIIEVNEASRESDLHYVEFSIGTGKVELKNGQSLEINDITVDDVAVTITTSAGTLSQINLAWTIDDEAFLVPGMDLTFPGLESTKLSMASFGSSNYETMNIANNGDDYMQLNDVKVKDGTVSNLPILYSDVTTFTGLGKDATHTLVTSQGGINGAGSTTSIALNLDEDVTSYFVASRATSDDWESYVFELISVNEVDSGVHNETKIKNLATGQEIIFTDADDKDFGEITLTTSAVHGDEGNVTITISGTDVYADRIYTDAGMGIQLPLVNSTSINSTRLNSINGNPVTWNLRMTEGDKDNAVDSTTWTATLAHATKGCEVDAISPDELAVESGSDNYEAYVVGAHATKMLYKTGGDQDTLDIMYPLAESYATVFVSESSAVTTGGATGLYAVKDADLTSTDKTKNLIVVGGSCINSVAASLLGSSTPMCGDAWQTKTNAGAGQFIIQAFASPYSSSKTALLVAGYDAADTQKAATYLVNKQVDTAVGKKYLGTSATEATLIA